MELAWSAHQKLHQSWLQLPIRIGFFGWTLSDWNRNFYLGWLYSLKGLIARFPEGYPSFMRTEAWEKKELNAVLSSWTDLRHDTILYAKQSYTPPIGIPPELPGYVEPVPEFYGRLLALTQITRRGLSELDVLSQAAAQRLVNLESILSRLIELSGKQLNNEILSDEDCAYIRGFDERLKRAIIGVNDKAIVTTLVADVYTHSLEEKVLEEGVGYVDLIIVACPHPDGGAFLAAGPVLSYYDSSSQ